MRNLLLGLFVMVGLLLVGCGQMLVTDEHQERVDRMQARIIRLINESGIVDANMRLEPGITRPCLITRNKIEIKVIEDFHPLTESMGMMAANMMGYDTLDELRESMLVDKFNIMYNDHSMFSTAEVRESWMNYTNFYFTHYVYDEDGNLRQAAQVRNGER